MRRKILLLATGILVTVFSWAQGVNFERVASWKQVLDKAREENKYIFLDFYATWCVPCKEMDEKVYPDQQLGALLREKMISVKVQIDSTANDSQHIRQWYEDAKMIKEKYQIKSLPTILFLSSEGKPVHFATGFKEVEDMKKLVNDAFNPEKQFYTLLEKYKNGEIVGSQAMYLARYAKTVQENDLAKAVSEKYINDLPETEIFKKDNLEFIHDFTSDVNDRGFKLFSEYPEKIDRVLGPNTANDGRYGIILGKILGDLRKTGGTPDYTKIEKEAVARYGGQGARAAYAALAGYAWETGDLNNFVKYKDKTHAAKWEKDIQYFYMNNDAWWVFERTGDRKKLMSALAWQKKVLEGEGERSTTLDTYANILYRLGRINQAIKWQEKAMKLANEEALKFNSSPNPAYQATLVKMKEGLPTWPSTRSSK